MGQLHNLLTQINRSLYQHKEKLSQTLTEDSSVEFVVLYCLDKVKQEFNLKTDLKLTKICVSDGEYHHSIKTFYSFKINDDITAIIYADTYYHDCELLNIAELKISSLMSGKDIENKALAFLEKNQFLAFSQLFVINNL